MVYIQPMTWQQRGNAYYTECDGKEYLVNQWDRMWVVRWRWPGDTRWSIMCECATKWDAMDTVKPGAP